MDYIVHATRRAQARGSEVPRNSLECRRRSRVPTREFPRPLCADPRSIREFPTLCGLWHMLQCCMMNRSADEQYAALASQIQPRDELR